MSSSKRKHPRKAKSTNTLHDYFAHRPSASAKPKATATPAPHEIIVIDSDDSEVEVVQVIHNGKKRQKLSDKGSCGEVGFVVDQRHVRVDGTRSTPHRVLNEACRDPPPRHSFNKGDAPLRSFGAPRLLLEHATGTVNPPSSTESLSFGTPSLLLVSHSTALEVQHLPTPDKPSRDFDLLPNADDDWGMGDDEMAFAPIPAEPEEEEEVEDLSVKFSSTSKEISPQLTSTLAPICPSFPLPSSNNQGSSLVYSTQGNSDAFSLLMSSHKENEAWKEASVVEDRTFRPNKSNGNRRKAPFYKVLQGMPIAVDAFRYGAIPGINAYFLTHAHSDHYTNLAANWKSGLIYCSKGTANLIIHMLGVERKWVRPLPMDVPTIVPDTGGVSVTLIEANHCPGSCLFLFEGPQTINAGDSSFKSPFVGSSKVFRYLHCGDFRASPQHILHPAVKGKKIDHVYLDTTYLDPKYTFPPQPVVISACAELAKSIVSGQPIAPENKISIDVWMKPLSASTRPDTKTYKTLFVIGTYSIGKERVVKAVAQALETKVYCDARKTAILLCQADSELHGLLTSNPLDACVHLLPLGMITSDKLKNYLERFKGTFGKAVGFRPTGWTYAPPAGSDLMPSISSILSRPHRDFTYASLRTARQSTSTLQLFPVPYSEHSSFFELTCFAMSFDWGKMIATVNVGSENSRGKMAKWVAKWQAERNKRGTDIIVPHRHLEYW